VSDLIVKVEPVRGPLEPYDLALEASVLHVVGQNGYPVPAVHLVGDRSVFGREFVVMDRVPGHAPALKDLEQWEPWRQNGGPERIGRSMVQTLARLQRIDPNTFPRPCGPVDTDVVRGRIRSNWGRLRARLLDVHGANPVVTDAARWLIERTPALSPSEAVWLHGDFRIGNIVFDEDVQVAGVIDWERASVGDPVADLGFMCLPMGNHSHPELMGMVLPRPQLIDLFEQATGTSVDPARLDYYIVYALFMEAVAIGCALSMTLEPHPDLRYAFAAKLFAEVSWLLADRILAYESTYGPPS
jgi:aminoglycoside phosphotransferase (APT) family kinase protein